MDLPRVHNRRRTALEGALFLAPFLLFLCGPPLAAQSRPAPRPGLIRDTGVADAEENAPEPKAPDPILCEQNIKIGDFYFKKKNYDAAIMRYRDAIEYQANSVRAFDSLARAYEKKGERAKAIATYRQFIKENPDSPKLSEFRSKLEKLEKSVR